jgi:hypothetical protein
LLGSNAWRLNNEKGLREYHNINEIAGRETAE